MHEETNYTCPMCGESYFTGPVFFMTDKEQRNHDEAWEDHCNNVHHREIEDVYYE